MEGPGKAVEGGQRGCSLATDIYENIIMKPVISCAN